MGRLGVRRMMAMGMFDSGISYLLRDDFTDTVAAGAINATLCTPGPGTRTVTDTGSLVSIGSGVLAVSGTAPGNGNPLLNLSGNTRAAGICGRMKFRHYEDISGSLSTQKLGFHAASFANSHIVQTGRNTTTAKNPAYMAFGGVPDNGEKVGTQVWSELLIRLRATGAAYYVNGGNRPRLAWIQTTVNTTPLWFGMRGEADVVVGYDVDYLHLFKDTWIQSAVISDSFNRADGAAGNTDGLGCEEGGGSGVVWTDALGTLTVATNKAAYSGLTGGVGLSLVPTSNGNVYAMVKLYRTAGVCGIVFKYKDTNNYCVAWHDGTNVVVRRVVGGVGANATSAAKAYADGAVLAVSVTEIGVTVWYNNANLYIINQKYTGNTNMPVDGTQVGLYTTDAGNTFDDFAVFETYPSMPLPKMSFPGWSAFGDSLTDLNGASAIAVALQSNGKNYAVRDYGVGGQTTAQGLLRFTSNVLTKPDSIVSIQMGVNDLWGVATPAGANTVKTNLQTMYTAAKAAGKTVIAISLYPCKGSTSYDANAQANIDLINAWILDPVNGATNVDYRLDAYAILEDPGVPDTLLAAYDDGSHLHLSTAGYAAVANGVYALGAV